MKSKPHPRNSSYVCPSRRKKKVLAGHVDPLLAATVHAALAHDGVSLQRKIEELFREYVDDYLHRSENYPELAPDLIEERAKAIWRREGRPADKAEEHWHRAATELAVELVGQELVGAQTLGDRGKKRGRQRTNERERLEPVH